MTSIVEGRYAQGKIELLETPVGLPEGPVRLIVIPRNQAKPLPCLLTYGKYRSGAMSTLEDFKHAEWHGEKELAPRIAKGVQE